MSLCQRSYPIRVYPTGLLLCQRVGEAALVLDLAVA